MVRLLTGARPQIVYSQRKAKAVRKARKREEERWAARSGPVIVVKPASSAGEIPSSPAATDSST